MLHISDHGGSVKLGVTKKIATKKTVKKKKKKKKFMCFFLIKG